jgi:hypothetical protein
MWAENNLEGSGATFYFTLPLAEDDKSLTIPKYTTEKDHQGAS